MDHNKEKETNSFGLFPQLTVRRAWLCKKQDKRWGLQGVKVTADWASNTGSRGGPELLRAAPESVGFYSKGTPTGRQQLDRSTSIHDAAKECLVGCHSGKRLIFESGIQKC